MLLESGRSGWIGAVTRGVYVLLQLIGKYIRWRALNLLLCEVERQMNQECQSLPTVFSGLWKNHSVPSDPQVLLKSGLYSDIGSWWRGEIKLSWCV